MARILCIANQKGGVGKTTTAINLAVTLARSGLRTLLVDLDPQCNATTGLGHQPAERHQLLRGDEGEELLEPVEGEPLFLMPGTRSLADVEMLVRLSREDMERVCRQWRGQFADFQMVVLDCPPSLGALTRSALAVATEVIMPVQCEYFAMEGLTQMIVAVRQVQSWNWTSLSLGGILLTMHDHRLELAQEVEQEVRSYFGQATFQTVIPRDVAAAEAPSHGLAVVDYAPRSRAARAYLELCMEVLESEQGQTLG
ncbi:MAG: chromosome partitioning protein ParA [Pirellulaceae bacterium]|nr:MAG: chromosome partitioning protein ParA [Pirellulaceae bacterium]